MSKYTIELTGMNFNIRIPCSFCGREESDTHYELIKDGKKIDWMICEACFQLFKADTSKALERSIEKHKAWLKEIEDNIKELENLSQQNIEVIGRKNIIDDCKLDEKILAEIKEQNKKYGNKVICRTRCSNCDGNPGERHLLWCANIV